MNKWIIFDAMGVIFTVGDDTKERLIPYICKRNKNMAAIFINETYQKASLGKISSLDFWRAMNICEPGREVETCADYLDTCIEINEKFIQVAQELKRTYNLAILSNDVSEWSKYLRDKFNLNDLIACAIISGDVNFRKPDPEIFRLIINKIGASPSDCIFIDDNDRNLAAASAQGLNIIRFSGKNESSQLDQVVTINSFTALLDLL